MSSTLFLFLEGICLGIVIGAGLVLFVMTMEQIEMRKRFKQTYKFLESEVKELKKEVEQFEKEIHGND